MITRYALTSEFFMYRIEFFGDGSHLRKFELYPDGSHGKLPQKFYPPGNSGSEAFLKDLQFFDSRSEAVDALLASSKQRAPQ